MTGHPVEGVPAHQIRRPRLGKRVVGRGGGALHTWQLVKAGESPSGRHRRRQLPDMLRSHLSSISS